MQWSLQLLLCVARCTLCSLQIIFSFLFPLQFFVKMVINQSYLFVLLLASFSASCTSDCPTWVTTPAQHAYDECAKLYSILEKALFENPGNLYQLHDSFYPGSSSELLYAAVSFKVNAKEWLQGFCWTSSALLRSVDPSVLAFLQLDLINLLLVPVGNYGQTNYARLSINLKVNFTESDYSDFNATINAVLQELTSLVSIQLECWIN